MPASLDDVLRLLAVFAGERWPNHKLDEVQFVMEDGTVKNSHSRIMKRSNDWNREVSEGRAKVARHSETGERRVKDAARPRPKGSIMLETTTLSPTVEALELQLRQAGFMPGVPRHIDERTQSIDAHVCRRMKCPGCHRRRMTYRPFCNGAAYRVVAACACGSAEEV